MAENKDYLNFDYGEGQMHLGKIIPKLTDAQKERIDWFVVMARSVPEHPFTEDELRRDYAFAEVFSDEAFSLALRKEGNTND